MPILQTWSPCNVILGHLWNILWMHGGQSHSSEMSFWEFGGQQDMDHGTKYGIFGISTLVDRWWGHHQYRKLINTANWHYQALSNLLCDTTDGDWQKVAVCHADTVSWPKGQEEHWFLMPISGISCRETQRSQIEAGCYMETSSVDHRPGLVVVHHVQEILHAHCMVVLKIYQGWMQQKVGKKLTSKFWMIVPIVLIAQPEKLNIFIRGVIQGKWWMRARQWGCEPLLIPAILISVPWSTLERWIRSSMGVRDRRGSRSPSAGGTRCLRSREQD